MSNNSNNISISFDTSVCEQIPSGVVATAINKEIVSTEPKNSGTTNVCQYYINETSFVSLRLNNLNYSDQQQGQITLGRQITTNPRLHLEHFIATQPDGLINEIVLKINDNLFIAVDRSSGSSFSDEDMLQLASDISDYIITGIKDTDESASKDTNEVTTVEVSAEDLELINNFWDFVNNNQASDAVMMMSAQNTTDDSVKQSWGVQFNDFDSVQIVSITAQNSSDWTDTYHQYKVVLDVTMDPDSANAVIPYYGYQDGQNTRYMSLVYEDGVWKVDEIATGP